MDNEKEIQETRRRLPANALDVTPDPIRGGNQRIQFTANVKPGRTKHAAADDNISTSGAAGARRTSIPHVPSEKERRKRDKEEGKKNVDIDEHLMSQEEVAAKYQTKIDMVKPGESLGLSERQVEQLTQEYGPNILTPPKKRHPI